VLASLLVALGGEDLQEAVFDPELRDTVYWVALLRYLGCTGHAHEIATVFGDDIAVLAETLVFDAADPGRRHASHGEVRDSRPCP
jgi:hypothetical protein